ncbi:hypothetical protein ACO0SA_001992 [Hanseniaspora valbyensis]
MSRVVDVTIGKHDSSITYLTTSDFKVLEFPSSLLPDNIKTGAVLKIQIDFNESLAKETNNKFINFQNNLLDKISTFKPKKPELFVKTKLPTSITLAWEPLNLGIAKLKNVSLWHKSLTPNFSGSSETVDEEEKEVFSIEDIDEEELSQIATIYNIQNRTYKLTGLDISSKHVFQLRIDTSNGIYSSDMMLAETLSSNDLSGFNICVGALSDGNTTFDDIKAVADALNISQLSRHCNEDTTHYITDTVDDENEEHDLQLNVAKNLNIPIVKPNWLQGCLKEKQLLGVKKFYYKLDKDDKNNLSEQYPFEKSFTEDYLRKIKVVKQQQEEEHKEEVKEAETEGAGKDEEEVKEEIVKTAAEEKKQEPDAEKFVLEKKEDEVVVEDPVLEEEQHQITDESAPTETVDISADKENPGEEIVEKLAEEKTVPDIAEATVTEAPIEQLLEEINETENIKDEDENKQEKEEEEEVPLAEDPVTKLSTEKTNTISETPEVKEQILTETPTTDDNVDSSVPENKQDPSLTPSSSTSSKKANKKNKNKKK